VPRAIGLPLRSLRTCVAAQRWHDWLLLAAVLFCAGSYWFVSVARHADEPLSMHVLYRAGDIQIYPAIAFLSRLEFGEATIHEHLGEGVQTVPVWSILPHAVAMRLFGPAGFVVVDALGFLAFYWAFSSLLRRVGVSALPAKAIALIVLCGAAEAWHAFLFSLAPLKPYETAFEFWRLRIPRPLTTSPMLCLCLLLLVQIVSDGPSPRTRKRMLLLGIAWAILLQADPYSAAAVGFCVPVAFGCVLLQHRGRLPALSYGILLCAAGAVLFAVPYLFQRLHELPDLQARLGVFPVDRWHPLFLPWPSGTFLWIVWLLVLCVAALLLAVRSYPKRRVAVTALLVLAVVSTASCFALPACCVLLGKSVQTYHFALTFHVFCWLTALALLVTILELTVWTVRSLLPGFAQRPRVVAGARTVLVLAVVGLSLFYTLQRSRDLSDRSWHMRSDFDEYAAMGTGYRGDFDALLTELQKARYADCDVLGSFDHQVYVWWTTFRQGRCFLADPILSVLPDRRIEDRLIALCQVFGMDAEDFRAFVNRRYVNAFWLGHNKYNASRAHTFSPLSDYTPEQQHKISVTNVLGSWHLQIPISEQARLLRRFEELQDRPLPGRLDLIVQAQDPSLSRFSPSSQLYENTYRSPSFSIWLRRTDVPPPL